MNEKFVSVKASPLGQDFQDALYEKQRGGTLDITQSIVTLKEYLVKDLSPNDLKYLYPVYFDAARVLLAECVAEFFQTGSIHLVALDPCRIKYAGYEIRKTVIMPEDISQLLRVLCRVQEPITGALTAKAFLTSGLTDGNVWAGVTAPDFGDDGIMGILSAAMSFLNPLAQIPSLLLGLIGFIVAIVLSVTLLLTVIGRFFKIYLFAALSPIPLACFGSESTQSVGQNFLRAFAGVSLEGFIVGIAMILFAAYSQAPLVDFGSVGIFQWLGSAADEMAYMYTLIFNMLLLLGIIKGADQVTHRIFGV